MIQQDLFGDSSISQQNPLTDRRVGFIGSYVMSMMDGNH